MPDEWPDSMDISPSATHVIMSTTDLDPLLIKPLGRFWRRKYVVTDHIFEANGKFDRYVGIQF